MEEDMNLKNERLVSIMVVLLILSSTLFCTLFQPKPDLEGEGESTLTTPTTPIASPTLEPTNLVKIEDTGQLLHPQVLNTYPIGGQEMGDSEAIEVQFDQPMNQNTTSSAWELLDSSGESVNGIITWPQPDTLKFKSQNPLSIGETYQATISNSAESIDGVEMPEPVSFEVKIAENLIISQVFPADGTINVESNAVITIIFNRPVVPLETIEDQTNHELPIKISPPVSGSGNWVSTSVFVFRPNQPLASSTQYSVLVETGVVDLIGLPLDNPFQWTFTTAAPSVASFAIAGPVGIDNPNDNIEDIRLDSYFRVDFHQPMDTKRVEDALEIFSLGGERVLLDFDWSTDYQVVITPTQQLELGTNYTLLMSQRARAATGGELEEELRWNFKTVPYPDIESTYPADGENPTYFTNRFGIYFSSPINLNTIENKISVNPVPSEELTWYYDSWGWRVDFFGLEPSTNYTVVVGPGIEDIYGNPIMESYTFQFRTGRIRPGAYLDMPYMPSIYRLGGPMNFYVGFVNLDTVDVDLFKIPAANFVGFENGTYPRWEFIPPNDWLVNSWRWDNKAPENKIVRQSAQLKDLAGDDLEPGFYFMTMKSKQIPSQGPYVDTRLLVIAEANLTFKTTLTEGLIWVTDLTKGMPLQDISLAVYDGSFTQIGQGSTDSNGILYLELPEPDEVYQPRYVMTLENEPFAFAVSEWGSGASPYEFGIWSSFYTLPEQPMAYVYTDRPLYRPGQSVYFKGILRLNDDLKYSLMPWETVEVEINSFNESVYLEEINLSEYGTFSGEFILDENAALGYYSIQVRKPSMDEGVGGVSFSVAEYRVPEFQVNLEAAPTDVIAGEKFSILVSAEYFSGGGVGKADVDWAMRAADYIFQPRGEYSRYTFYDYDRDIDVFNENNRSNQSEIIASGKGVTDQDGNLKVEFTADLSEAGKSQLMTFEATIFDIADTSVSNRTAIIAHQAAVYPGIRPQKYVGEVNEEQIFEIVLLDWDANPLSGLEVDVEIVERRWYSVQEQDAQGFVRWSSSVEEIPVASFESLETDSIGKTKVGFLPEKGGVYKAKVTARDDFGNQAVTGAYIWVSGNESIAWRQTDDRRMNLVADKETYQPGDIAEILIASPFDGENYGLVTLERGHIRQQDVLLLTNNSSIYRLPITEEMAPNVYFSVIIIQGADQGSKPDFREGIIELNVAKDDQLLNVFVESDMDEPSPGDEVTYTIRTTDNQENPVRAEVSLALTDLATLSLMEPNSRPIGDYFYDRQSLGVKTTVPIVLSIEDYISTLEARLTGGEGMGSGGGKGADVFGVMEIRGDFQDTAFWEASVLTDQNGEAQVKVELPDNLTIWHMDARAVTLDTLVGSGEKEVRSTKPLLVRPQTPRFFVVGDETTLGAAVHNNTNNSLSVRVSLEGTGLSFETPKFQKVDISPNSQVLVTWNVKIDDNTDRVDLIFSAVGGNYKDSTRPTMGTLDGQGIPVYRYEALEIVGTSGMLSESGSRTEGVHIPTSWDTTQGELEIKLSPSLAAGLIDGLDYLKHFPYECVEQTISRFLPNVLTTQALDAAGIADPILGENLAEQVNTALQRIYNWQHPDGGWGWWSDALESDPLASSYVVLGLIEAQKAGYHVNQDTLTRSINYLKNNLKSLGKLDKQYELNRQAFMLYVLAKAGQPQVSFSSMMFDNRQSLSLYARAFLAEILWIIDQEDPRLDTLVSDFNSAAVVSAAGAFWQESWRDYWNWNTDTRTTAIILSALIKVDPGNSLNPKAVRWLMAHRTKGHWQTTQETAWSLMTLTEWMVASNELKADYDWAVGVNGNRLGDGTANQTNLREITDLSVDLETLYLDEINRITIARDEGEGSLYYTAFMDVYLPVDRIEPVDRGIMLSKEYLRPSTEGEGEPVHQAEQGDLLIGRLSLVVPYDLHYVVVKDPLPGGLEAVDQSLKISPDITAPDKYDFSTIWNEGWGYWYFDHVELRDEMVVISADYLPAGTYVYTYLVRASTPGVYRVIPTEAHEFYFPDVYGRSAGSKFTVTP
jgi:uncharacterized protein YfaS (alpha-2-macroglobulin family)